MTVLKGYKFIPPTAKQLRSYGACPDAQAFRFSVGRRGRPRLGDECKIFAEKEEVAKYLCEEDWRRTPKVKVKLRGGGEEPAHVEQIFEKLMIVLDKTEEIVFSVTPTIG